MRLLKRIPHERFLIEIHQYNQKFLLKITLDHYEQIFKIDESEVSNLNIFNTLVDSEFLQGCLTRFVSMRSDFLTEINKHNMLLHRLISCEYQ